MNKQQLANRIWASANKMRSKIEANEYKDYRRLAGVDKIPLFLIYMIDRYSKPQNEDKSGRTALNMDCDLIGITMVMPGIRGSRGVVTRLKIKPLELTQEVED